MEQYHIPVDIHMDSSFPGNLYHSLKHILLLHNLVYRCLLLLTDDIYCPQIGFVHCTAQLSSFLDVVSLTECHVFTPPISKSSACHGEFPWSFFLL